MNRNKNTDKVRVAMLLLMLLAASVGMQARDNARWVNPMIGTDLSDAPTMWGNYGGTYPGAVSPWGMVQITPETSIRPDERGYYYRDDRVLHFSLLDHASGYPNGSSGGMKVAFVRGTVDSIPRGYEGRKYSHLNEFAQPGYYSVQFADGDMAEMTAAPHSGMLRYTSISPTTTVAIVDRGLKIADRRTVTGKRHNAVMRFSQEFLGFCHSGDTIFLHFAECKPLTMEVMCSQRDQQSSERNGAAELCGGDFEAMRRAAYQRWSHELACVDVESADADLKTMFYTALYHSMLMPRNVADVGETPRYEGFSAWDTFRTLHPLMSLIKPERQRAMTQSLYEEYQRRGTLREGPMTGHHVIAILLDSYMKSATDLTISQIYEAAANSYERYLQRRKLQEFDTQGYIDASHAQSVSITAELAYDHWVMSQIAQKASRPKQAKRWLRGANNYRNLWDPATMFLLPRSGNRVYRNSGELGFQESTKWTASYFAPHDVNDLMNLHGGADRFAQRLQEGFERGEIVFDNEPALHYPTLFVSADRSELAMKYVRKVMRESYRNTPGGIPGNDDLGAMSSWWAMAALGLMPACPGTGEYVLLPTIFDKAVLHLESGKTLTISRKGEENELQMPSVSVGGKSWQGWCVNHAEMMDGGEICYDWTRQANEISRRPYSLTTEAPQIAVKLARQQKKSVKPDEQIAIAYTATNNGEIGAKLVQIVEGEKVLAEKLTTVASHSSISDTITFALYAEGKHRVQVEGTNMTFKVKRASKDAKTLRCEMLDAPALIAKDATVEVRVTVKNISGKAYAGAEPILLNDRAIAKIDINLQPGEEATYRSRFVARDGGFATICVLDKECRVKIYAEALDACVLDASLNEADKASDQSGFGNHGTGFGPLQWTDRYVQTTQGAYIEFPATPSLMQSTGAVTLMAWIKPLKVPRGYADFFSHGDYTVMKLQGKQLAFFAGGWGRGTCEVALPDEWFGVWHQVVGVGTGEMLTLYIDGEKVQQIAVSGTIAATEVPWNLGRNAEMPFSRFADMQIGTMRIYGAPLNENQVKSIYNKEKTHYIINQ